MSDDDQDRTIYVSPDGQSEMPVASPTQRINLEARGWRPKDDPQPAAGEQAEAGAPPQTEGNPAGEAATAGAAAPAGEPDKPARAKPRRNTAAME